MATVPSIIIQRLATGAVIPGTLPLISGSAPNLDTEVFKELRGRIWRYDEIDTTTGGLFESPVELVRRLVKLKKHPTKGLRHEQRMVWDRVGFILQRVFFQGTGTTRMQGFLRDPYAAAVVVSAEALTPVPAFDGSKKQVAAVLANAPVVPGSVVLITAGGGEEFIDNGQGRIIGKGDGSKQTISRPQQHGTIDYTTGEMRFTYQSAPATGTGLTADYRHISGASPVDHEFFDSDDITMVDPASFTWDATEGGAGNLLVPPGWQVRFVSTGALSAAASLGIMVSQGMDYGTGQEITTFGAIE